MGQILSALVDVAEISFPAHAQMVMLRPLEQKGLLEDRLTTTTNNIPLALPHAWDQSTHAQVLKSTYGTSRHMHKYLSAHMWVANLSSPPDYKFEFKQENAGGRYLDAGLSPEVSPYSPD